jgi:NAD(P)H-hydrate epimerase
MTLPLAQTREGTLSYKAVDFVLNFLSNMDGFALGPGITTHRDTQDFVRFISRRAPVAGVLDADGLNNLSADLTEVREAPAPRILTPHPGELARLESKTVAEVQADREEAVTALARRAKAVVVLKGWKTLVSDGEKLKETLTGNPGMASGGAGDVLTGVITALLASGMDPFDAAALGAHVHGRAGDLASEKVGEISLTALDILDGLGPAFSEVTEHHG